MSFASNARHYFHAVLRSVGDGSLPRKVNRYLHARRVDRAIEQRYGVSVQAGPFEGMQYIRIPPYRAFPGKILGFYEQELHSAIRETLSKPYDTVINVGSAEGYYTVGYARAFANANVYAFDLDKRQQAFCRQLARLNKVDDRVRIYGECRVESLEKLVTENTLIFMDCEGCEFSLLKPDRVLNLRYADMIVELHDFGDSSLKSSLQTDFASTHHINEIDFTPRHINEYAEVQFLVSDRDKEMAIMDRDVTSQSWFYLRSKQR